MDDGMCESAAIQVKRLADCLGVPPWRLFEDLVSYNVFTAQESSTMAVYFDYDE